MLYPTVEAYPLSWPSGRERKYSRQEFPNFTITLERARDELSISLQGLGARQVITSCDQPLRADGTPYTEKEPADTGVAVYFELDGKAYVIACDTYSKVRYNLRAIGATIEGLLVLRRYGAMQLFDQAIAGFGFSP